MILFEVLSVCECGELHQVWLATEAEARGQFEVLRAMGMVQIEIWRHDIGRTKGGLLQALNYASGQIPPSADRVNLECVRRADCLEDIDGEETGPSLRELN